MWKKWALAALLSWSALPALGESLQVEGEVLKITSKRTGFMVDLVGDLTLEKDASVKLNVAGKERTGKVTKVTDNGRAFIKLNKGLPASVKVGDSVAMEVESGASQEEPAAPKEGSARLVKGGASKAYWDEISFLAAHRNPGLRTDVAVAYLNGAGAEKSEGGTAANGQAINDDTEYAVEDKHVTFSGDVGHVGRGGFGGGALLTYNSQDRTTSADIDTAATGTTDSDKVETSRKVTKLMPYIEYLDRVKSGDIGFGLGLGIPIRSVVSERKVQIAGEDLDSEPAKTTETGLTIEAMFGNKIGAFILSLTPVLNGTIKQSGEDDVKHTSSEYALHHETYLRKVKIREGIVLINSKDAYDDDALTDKGWKLQVRLDVGMGSFNLIPFLDYQSLKRSRGDLSGKLTELDIGSRFAKAGIYAPFVSLGLNRKSETQTTQDDRDVATSIGGIRLAGGITI